MDKSVSTNHFDGEIDLRELFGLLWSGKIFIMAVTAAFAIGSVLIALSIPNQYKATVLLAPTQSDGGGLSSALDQLSGLATLAGVSLGEGSVSESQIAQEVMKSWSFAHNFISENNLEVAIFASEGWNKGSGKLIINDKVYDEAVGEWLLENRATADLRPPSSWELFTRFREMLSVSEDKSTGLVTLSIEFFSPNIAKEWVDLYVEAINRYMQERQIQKVANNINYLEGQIEKTSIAEMREVFYTIIEEQTKNKMVAEASPNYVFVVVSASMIPEVKSKPSRALICVIGSILGAIVGTLVFLVWHWYKRRFT